jgi:hypothetical protein
MTDGRIIVVRFVFQVLAMKYMLLAGLGTVESLEKSFSRLGWASSLETFLHISSLSSFRL